MGLVDIKAYCGTGIHDTAAETLLSFRTCGTLLDRLGTTGIGPGTCDGIAQEGISGGGAAGCTMVRDVTGTLPCTGAGWHGATTYPWSGAAATRVTGKGTGGAALGAAVAGGAPP